MMLLQSIILAVTTHFIYAMPQLTFQTDPYRNTFTLKTPSLQQTFTRYYGGQQQVNGLPTVGRLHNQQQQQSLNVQQQHQEQPHQFVPAQQYADAYTVPQNFLSDTIQQPYQLGLPQRSEYTSPNSLQQPQNYQQQQIYISNDQQLQQQNYFQQLQSVQPLFFASRQQEQQQQAAAAQSQLDSFSSTAVTATQQQQQQQQHQQPQLHSQENNLLGVAFSPSDQVSHVKFSNGEGLKYNF